MIDNSSKGCHVLQFHNTETNSINRKCPRMIEETIKWTAPVISQKELDSFNDNLNKKLFLLLRKGSLRDLNLAYGENLGDKIPKAVIHLFSSLSTFTSFGIDNQQLVLQLLIFTDRSTDRKISTSCGLRVQQIIDPRTLVEV